MDEDARRPGEDVREQVARLRHQVEEAVRAYAARGAAAVEGAREALGDEAGRVRREARRAGQRVLALATLLLLLGTGLGFLLAALFLVLRPALGGAGAAFATGSASLVLAALLAARIARRAHGRDPTSRRP